MSRRIPYAAACLLLHERIVERWGCHAELADALDFTIARPTNADGFALMASPLGRRATGSEMAVSYFGSLKAKHDG